MSKCLAIDYSLYQGIPKEIRKELYELAFHGQGMLRSFFRKPYLVDCVVAWHNDKPIGWSAASLEPVEHTFGVVRQSAHLYIYVGTYVLKKYRSVGIGTELLKRLSIHLCDSYKSGDIFATQKALDIIYRAKGKRKSCLGYNVLWEDNHG